MSNQITTNVLGELADKANVLHHTLVDKYLEVSRQIGQLMSQAREHLGDVPFRSWVDKYCRFSLRSAYNYLFVFDNWAEIERQEITTISAALNLRKAETKQAVEESFPRLSQEDQAEYEQIVAQDEQRTAKEREERVREKRASGGKGKVQCPNCGVRFKP